MRCVAIFHKSLERGLSEYRFERQTSGSVTTLEGAFIKGKFESEPENGDTYR
ncbi:hypothetical protein JXJ21_17500 [candidate division KSB1 bacterium]|nr:hypothetical protein [candidate division KSB1 bacterium]